MPGYDSTGSPAMTAATQQFFAPCPRGLESVLAEELKGIEASTIKATHGGVHFQGNWQTCYRANLESRIASRILWQIADQPYRTEIDIYHATLALPWPEWFSADLTIRVNLAAIKCPLRSLDFVTLRIKDAICDKFRQSVKQRPNVNTTTPDIRIHGFLDAQHFSLYLDTSGEALFKRGYRTAAGTAPLRENLAAGILSLSNWQPGIPLLDPMCGSGTFLLEALQRAFNIAPGIQRHFAFEQFNQFDRESWQQIRDTALSLQHPASPQPIYGSDLHGKALDDTRTNLEAANFLDYIHLKQANILEISAPQPHGILITNPPYGVRLGEAQSLSALYPKLGDVFKKKFAGWTIYLFSADPLLPKSIRLSASRRTPLFNGALECRLFKYTMVEGSMR